MGATPKNFKTIGKDEGPSPLNSMECGKVSSVVMVPSIAEKLVPSSDKIYKHSTL
jgi:hypothetical protein